MLPPIFLDCVAVYHSHVATAGLEMASQILVIMAGRFHAYQYDLSSGVANGCVDCLAQLFKPGAKNIHLETGRDDFAQPIMQQHNVEIFANIYRDAQNLFQADTAYPVSKGLASLAAQVRLLFLFHEYLLWGNLLMIRDGVDAGSEFCAPSVFSYECQPLPLFNWKYSIRYGDFVKVL